MLESFVGRKMLKEGLQLYLRENEFGNAATDDLWAALTKVTQSHDSPLDIKVFSSLLKSFKKGVYISGWEEIMVKKN